MTGSGFPRSPGSPVPDEVATELQRVVERWRQLPLDRALSYSGRVRAFIQSLADHVAETKSAIGAGDGSVDAGTGLVRGAELVVVPDLGPATLMDQLTVMVYDISAAEASTSVPVRPSLAKELARLRSELR